MILRVMHPHDSELQFPELAGMVENEDQESSNYLSISAALEAEQDDDVAPFSKVVNLAPMSSDSDTEIEDNVENFSHNSGQKANKITKVHDPVKELNDGTNKNLEVTTEDACQVQKPEGSKFESGTSPDGEESDENPVDDTADAGYTPVPISLVPSESLRQHLTEGFMPLPVPVQESHLQLTYDIWGGEDSSNETTNKTNECPVCLRLFKRKDTLKRHLTTHTGEREFVCPTCGKDFSTPQSLKQHEMVHSKARPFTCEYCEKTFRYRSQLVEHVRSHSGIKPYQCTECEAAFNNGQTLKVHMRIHTGSSKMKSKRGGFNIIYNQKLTL
jgi:DNA-directed RNA polymerase subunit RPC12/RpoP